MSIGAGPKVDKIGEDRFKTFIWEWNGDNPYDKTAMQLLGLSDSIFSEAQLRAQSNRMVRRVKENDKQVSLLKNSRDILLDPASRLVAELMRIPPFSLSPEVIKGLKQKCKPFSKMGSLPVPDSIGVNVQEVGKMLLKGLALNESKLPENKITESTSVANLDYAALETVTFSQRPMKDKKTN